MGIGSLPHVPSEAESNNEAQDPVPEEEDLKTTAYQLSMQRDVVALRSTYAENYHIDSYAFHHEQLIGV